MPVKSTVRWIGRNLKNAGMKMLGEIDSPTIQPYGLPPSAKNVGTTAYLTIGFWNVGKNVKTAPDIAKLAVTLQNENGQRNDVLLGLSEIDGLKLGPILADIIKLTGNSSWAVYQSVSHRFACFSNVPIVSDLDEVARGWPVIISLNEPSKSTPARCGVWFVHLRSPIMTFSPENVSTADAQTLHRDIIRLEGSKHLDASVAIGDFNADPYSNAMLSPYNLNAVMCRKIASQRSRVFDKGKSYAEVRPYFYNPMWNSLGDQSANKQPGSFYKANDPGNSNAWHLIDQVLLRPSLVDRIVSGSPRLLINSGKSSLLNTKGKIDLNISDHLPVVISLNR